MKQQMVLLWPNALLAVLIAAGILGIVASELWARRRIAELKKKAGRSSDAALTAQEFELRLRVHELQLVETIWQAEMASSLYLAALIASIILALR